MPSFTPDLRQSKHENLKENKPKLYVFPEGKYIKYLGFNVGDRVYMVSALDSEPEGLEFEPCLVRQRS